ncbi:hypothetical protein BC831DRAFT_281166 [Entophlyctis helioformis]|nr:hypothetical protein BC831DRAFT_281166 [Entophlyctis helioformis]
MTATPEHGQATTKTPMRRNFFSFITLSWLTPTLRIGYKRPLVESDLPLLSEANMAAASADVFDGFWAQFAAHTASPKTVRPPSLFLTLMAAYWPRFVAIMLLIAVVTGANVGLPLLISQVIQALFLEDRTQLIWLSALFFGLQVLSTVCAWTEKSINIDTFIKMRSSTIPALYGKALRLSHKSRQSFEAGKINSLITSDVYNVLVSTYVFPGVISSIVQIVLCVFNIARFLGGPSTLVAAGSFLGLMLIQACFLPMVSKGFSEYFKALDDRTKRLREFLYGIKIIKYQAAEESFHKPISEARGRQVGYLTYFLYPMILIFVCTALQQNGVPIVAFIAYSSFTGTILSADKVFTVLALVSALSGPASSIADSTIGILQLRISYKRISEFLLAEETGPNELTDLLPADASKDGSALKMDKASFTWETVKNADKKDKKDKKAAADAKKDAKDASAETVVETDSAAEETKEEPFKLEDINLSIPRGSLVAVVGSVGSGKSSFLSALIGGMRKTAGSSSVYGSVAYCAQEPWILTGTIEENIVFSDDSVRPNIAKAVSASCLEHDLEILPNGLGTQIGEKGINLSGGQKARVALARAIARDADIYLLDDPIAALDAHVGKKVFDEAICGTLKSKTVVLVTHQLHLLPKVDFVVVLDNGRVAETGTFKDLMAVPESALSGIMKDYHFDDEEAEGGKKIDDKKPEDTAKAVAKFEDEKAVAEDRREGAVSMDTIRSYFLAAGYIFFGLIILLVLLNVGATSFVRIMLVIWIEDKWRLSFSNYFNLYAGLGALDTLIVVLLTSVVLLGTYKSAIVLHNRALDGLIRTPMSFFDSQPIGRILNRMTTDVQSLDLSMGDMFVGVAFGLVGLIASIIVVVYSNAFLLSEFASSRWPAD